MSSIFVGFGDELAREISVEIDAYRFACAEEPECGGDVHHVTSSDLHEPPVVNGPARRLDPVDNSDGGDETLDWMVKTGPQAADASLERVVDGVGCKWQGSHGVLQSRL